MVKRKSTPSKRTPKKCTTVQIGSKKFKLLRTTLREIKRLQASTENCIPRLPFSRLIREILMEEGSFAHRIQIEALRALQEAAEIYLTYLFEDANRCAMHARRVTLMPRDINLVLDLRGHNDPGN